jgi:hypothetical protein
VASSGIYADDAVTLNDNTILEYLLHDDVFIGLLGVLECRSATPLTWYSKSAND